jgi:NAD(P)-dependent dehydrogenase (short-subunit alcohol dehydrogenase family)
MAQACRHADDRRHARKPGATRTFLTRIPMGRVGQPDELVGPIVFLSCAMASYVTGITLAVDGGFLAI